MDDRSVVSGENVWFQCPYSGYPVRKVEWRKGGEILGHIIPGNVEISRYYVKKGSLFHVLGNASNGLDIFNRTKISLVQDKMSSGK